jgi:thiamine biosynthesis lipoprotein
LQTPITLLLATALLTGCAQPQEVRTFAGFAQGTLYHISYWSKREIDETALRRAVSDELEDIDRGMSDYRDDSRIERFNAAEDTRAHDVGNDIIALVEQARIVNLATGGCYDLTVRPLFDLWGFMDDQFSRPEPERLRKALAMVGMDKLEVVSDHMLKKAIADIKVDLSSIAQGYSVTRVAQVLEQRGVQDYIVEIGGELQTRGHKPGDHPWRIAIEKPLPGGSRVEKVITIARTSPLAIMTSGTYRHFFDENGVRYSHILDARTGYPVSHATVSVTVVYPDATAADAWSTALLCLGREASMKVADDYGIPALFIEETGDGLRETFSPALRSLPGITVE